MSPKRDDSSPKRDDSSPKRDDSSPNRGRSSPTRSRRIAAILVNDARAFTRDRFLLIISIVALAFYIAIYYLLPDRVDETVRVGIYQPEQVTLPAIATAAPGLELVRFPSSQALADAVAADRELIGGVALPDNLTTGTHGEPIRVTVYVDARTPPELRPLISSLVRELTFFAIDEPLPVSLPRLDTLVVGQDRTGAQPSSRDRFGSFLTLMILGMEMIALGSLVAKEVQSRTVTAILVSPATVFDFLAAKALFGTTLAFVQAVIVLLAIGVLALAPGPLLILVFLGALMFTGLGMVAGARGRNFTEVLFWVILFFVPALVPAIAALFPGTTSIWVQALPTYPLAAALEAVTNHAGLAAIAPWIAWIAAWDVVLFGLGWLVLQRKVRTL